MSCKHHEYGIDKISFFFENNCAFLSMIFSIIAITADLQHAKKHTPPIRAKLQGGCPIQVPELGSVEQLLKNQKPLEQDDSFKVGYAPNARSIYFEHNRKPLA